MLVFICSKNVSRFDSAVRAVPSGLPVTAIFMSFYTNDRANTAQGETIMTYTNELPSNLLSMETFMRLSKLGCAVTAGQKTARKQEQSARASGASKRGSGSARIAALVYGKAASL